MLEYHFKSFAILSTRLEDDTHTNIFDIIHTIQLLDPNDICDRTHSESPPNALGILHDHTYIDHGLGGGVWRYSVGGHF